MTETEMKLRRLKEIKYWEDVLNELETGEEYNRELMAEDDMEMYTVVFREILQQKRDIKDVKILLEELKSQK